MTDREKLRALHRMDSAALERIVAQYTPTNGPLAGMVAIDGIGHVRLVWIKQVLADREDAA